MTSLINFRGAIINLSYFAYAIIENKVMEKGMQTWHLRVNMSTGNGFTLGYDTEHEAQEAYLELCNMITLAHKTEAIR